MEPLQVDGAVVNRIVDVERMRFAASDVLPSATTDELAAAPGIEGSWDPATGEIELAFGGYLVESGGLRILVDTGVGVGKSRAARPGWDQRDSTAFLDALADLGTIPADVDLVVATHLHADHVGWNTVRGADGWAPTFPNARYVIAAAELDFWRDRHAVDPGVNYGSFADSVAPLLDAGVVDTTTGGELAPGVTLEPWPGHTPGTALVRVGRPGDGDVLVVGDVLHHPVQLTRPEWSSRFCCDSGESVAAREKLLDAVTDVDTVVLAPHFAAHPAVRVVSGPRGREPRPV